MTSQLQPPTPIDEPQQAEEYAAAISRVMTGRETLIVRRDGADAALIVPVDFLELLQEAIAREEAERLTKTIDWKRLAKTSPPPQSYFDADEPKPF